MIAVPAIARIRSAHATAARSPVRWMLRLFVAAGAPNSEAARSNISALCRDGLLDAYQIEVVDVLSEPARAAADCVRMAPTLLQVTPHGVNRIVGGLGKQQRVLAALGLAGPVQ